MTIPMLYATFGPDEQGKMKANSVLDFTLGVFGTGVIWYFLYFVWFNQLNFLLLMQPDMVTTYMFVPQHQKGKLKERVQNLCAILLPIFNIFGSVYSFFEVSAVEIHKSGGILSPIVIKGTAYVLLIVLFNIQHNFFQVLTLRFREKTEMFCELVSNIHLCRSQHKHTETILREYEKLDLYVDQLNEKFGTWVLISAVVAIPYLSQKFIELFKGSVSVVIGLLNIPFLVAEIFYLLMAAESCFQVRNILTCYYTALYLYFIVYLLSNFRLKKLCGTG